MNKIAVYTSLFGDYDILRAPIYKDCDFFCFSDRPEIVYKGWNIIQANPIDPIRTARYYKLHPHDFLDHDYFLWQDACMVLKKDPFKLIDQLENESLGIYPHAELKTYEDEIRLICGLQKDNIDLVQRQYSFYKEQGLPKDVPIFETTIMVVKNNQLTRQFFVDWWSELKRFSRRDQVSLPFLLWEKKVNCVGLKPGTIYHNPFFKHYRHKHELTIKMI
jgi:hypothetical protein